jgi:hypothetical protein
LEIKEYEEDISSYWFKEKAIDLPLWKTHLVARQAT